MAKKLADFIEEVVKEQGLSNEDELDILQFFASSDSKNEDVRQIFREGEAKMRSNSALLHAAAQSLIRFQNQPSGA